MAVILASARTTISSFILFFLSSQKIRHYLAVSNMLHCTDFDAMQKLKEIDLDILSESLEHSLLKAILFTMSRFYEFKDRSFRWEIKWIFTPMNIFQKHFLTLPVSMFFFPNFSFFSAFHLFDRIENVIIQIIRIITRIINLIMLWEWGIF